MGTRWKNSWVLIVWLLLFTHGLSGIMMGFVSGRDYINKDYFQSYPFNDQLNHFIDLLIMFELNDIPKEEAKSLIFVTAEEIEEHRYRYGTLEEQIANIKGQYEGKIQEALAANNQNVANAYIAERDKKIEDITNNFKSDEHVRVKIWKEKEQKIEDYYLEVENQRAEFEMARKGFHYYLKDTETGLVYTNLNAANANESGINPQDMNYIRTYPSAKYGYLSVEGRSSTLAQWITAKKTEMLFEGQIAVPKISPAVSSVLPQYNEFKAKQNLFYVYILSAAAALSLSLLLMKKRPILPGLASDQWQEYYNRVPIDARAGFFVISCLITLISLRRDNLLYLYEFLYNFLVQMVTDLGISSFFVALTVIQGKYLFETMKVRANWKNNWYKSILYRAFQRVKEAFLIRGFGTQIFILATIIFAFGAGLILAFMEPFLFLLYAIGWVVIMGPLLLVMIKRTGYFNQIVLHTSELAQGNLEPDLPIKGRSIFAALARNINLLKHGVKISLREQAKSERLKTELITNVSHDLRTPLTSIITYTELLKRPQLTEEERQAYLEIIDRKSKRLKVLIDDLFEVSKMASGSVELTKDRVDLVSLLQQALAEYSEQMNESNLHFRVTTPETPVYALVDGQKLWRVFENLIGNILKYSLENTRVYITIKSLPNQVLLTFKNVTKYEMGENSEELFERFKRGDTSRQTEGSGLGLAIAKSIIDLHEGRMEIGVDGDLFKVTLLLKGLS